MLQHEAAGRHESVSAIGVLLGTSRIESAHWSRVGAVTATNVELMAYAREHDHIVLTHDLDFSAILATARGTKPSVIQKVGRPQSRHYRGQVVGAERTVEGHLQSGALVSIEPYIRRYVYCPF